MQILDGTKISQKILDSLKQKIQNLNIQPILDIIIVGDNPSSLKYVELKQTRAKEIGIGGQVHQLDKNCSTQEIIDLINKLNNNSSITGLMVQLPLPPQINTNQILLSINPQKDVDGLNPINLALLFQGNQQGIASATSLGIIKLLEEYKIDLNGKNAVIVGRSPDVSLPLFAQLMAQNCTVTICHSHTQNLSQICREADILISSIGKPRLLGRDFIKKDAVIIDVGFGVDPQTGKINGDFDFDQIKDIVSFITPVPGGVGPMTVASLLYNTVSIAKTLQSM
jgi:methylenetetrahydrofolate dehydrogenase (NADP+)/methenyltetrahydrofolate cyclohydrolase